MFYRAWEAAKNRPARSMLIASLFLFGGGCVHFVATGIAFKDAIIPRDPISAAATAGAIASTALIASVAMLADYACVITGIILLILATRRINRGLP